MNPILFQCRRLFSALRRSNPRRRGRDELSPPLLINVGLPRTGTQSFTGAAEALGFVAAHVGYGERDAESLSIFKESGKGPIAVFMSHYDVLSDSPYYGLVDEITKFFPLSALVSTSRPKEEWMQSMANNPYAGGGFIQTAFGLPSVGARNGVDLNTIWEKHTGQIENLGVPIIDLAMTDDEKWNILCSLLEVDIPPGPWPNIDGGVLGMRNDAKAYKYRELVI